VAEGVLIANSAMLHPKTTTEPYKIYAGIPAKYLRDFDKDEPARIMFNRYLDWYVENTFRYPEELRRID